MTYGPLSYCPSAFAGPSASSPEVAGAAALVEQAYPAFGPDQVKQYLVQSAKDHRANEAAGAFCAAPAALPQYGYMNVPER